jgi:hypothetical protein
VGFTLTGARAATPPALPVEALDPPRLVVERGELADLRAVGHEQEAAHLSIALFGALTAASTISDRFSFGIGSGLNVRTDRWMNIASPIGMLRHE